MWQASFHSSEQFVGVEQDGDRPVIHNLNRHVRLEDARFDRHAERPESAHKLLVERLTFLGPGRFQEAWPTLGTRVAVKRELRHQQDGTPGIGEREIHLAMLVVEDPKVDDFLRKRGGRTRLILAPDGHEHSKPRADLARDLILDNDPRTADPLNDGSHILAILPWSCVLRGPNAMPTMGAAAPLMSETLRSSMASQRWLTRGVLGIGLASLFSDWGHEAATAILPTFLLGMGAPAVALGLIEGVSDGLSSFAKLAGGFIADRPQWRKPVGIIGYFATAISTFAYAFAQSWPFLLWMRAFGWMGRGARGPSRDTLLADSVRPEQQGRAFGFERAMDTVGAVLGPLSATALLGAMGARAVLRWTLVPGAAAAVAFAILAPAQRSLEHHPTSSDGGTRRPGFARLPKSFWHFLAGVFAHGIGDFAPTLFILRASQILTPRLGSARAATVSLALYTFYNIINAAVSYPAGALADRRNKRGLLAMGYLVSAVTCAGFILGRPTIAMLAILFGLAGVHGAFQQSLEKSAATELLPREVRGSGFGALATANGIGDLVSSAVVGALWSTVGPAAGFLYAGVFAVIGATLVFGWQ